jgi:hypothetical protein
VGIEQACAPRSDEKGFEDAVAAGEHRVVDEPDGMLCRNDLAVEGDDDLAAGRHEA